MKKSKQQPPTQKYTFCDIFAGCGGLSLGLINASISPVQAIEIDEFASERYRNNISDDVLVADIRDVPSSSFAPADLLVGGFPCQPFSISGLQRGFWGHDGDLFQECLRAIEATSPKVFVLENVPGFAQLNKGLFLRVALRELRKLGYHCDWKIVDAHDYGVPQSRKRMLIYGNNLGAENIFPEPTRPGGSVKDAIDDIRHGTSFLNNEPMKHTDRIVRRFAAVKPGETTLDAMQRNPELGSAKITKQCYRRLIPDEPAPTVVANFVTTTLHYCEHRNLTAREAARIQSFPDQFEFFGPKTRMSWQNGLSQFEQIGNAVPPLLGEAIGKSVSSMLNAPKSKSAASFQDDLFDREDEDIRLIEELISKRTKKGDKVKKRGRTSKYQAFYSEMEEANPGQKLKIPSHADSAFWTFFPAAMRRRRINFEADKDNGVVVKL